MPQVTAGHGIKPVIHTDMQEQLGTLPPAATAYRSSCLCTAAKFNLDILDADILDENRNTTRFLIMSRLPKSL